MRNNKSTKLILASNLW